MENQNSIQVENISKSFEIHHETNSIYGFLSALFKKNTKADILPVLKDISFTVKKGEMLGIIGLNASGKTTLLKILTKIYEPDSGTIKINGEVTPFLELGTGFNGELIARDNVIIYGMLLGLSKKQN